MTVERLGNKRSFSTKDSRRVGGGGLLCHLCLDFNPNYVRPYGSANLVP